MDRGEILDFRWSNVDTEAQIVIAPRGKTGHRRELPITMKMQKVLKAAGRIRNRHSDHVFLTQRGNPIPTDSGRKALRRAYDRAGVKGPPWKLLRHTFASRLAMSGVSTVAIARLLGHSSQAMGDRYLSLSPNFLRTELEKFEARYGEGP